MEQNDLQIVYRDIKDLKPFARNPKEHPKTQIDNIAQSITKYGWRAPILVSFETGEIVAGHGRLLAAKKLKLKRVPCIDASDMTPEQIAEYRYLDNKLNESAWNFEIVAEDLNSMDFSGFELEWEGFDVEATTEGVSEVSEADVGEDDIPDEPRAKMGDIYQLGRHRLMCGDSTDVESIEKLLDGASVGLVFTDPPYGVSVVDKDGTVGSGCMAKNQVYKKIKGDETTDTAQGFYHACVAIGLSKMILFGGNYFTDFLPFSDGWIVWDKRVDMNGNDFADGELAWCSFHTPVRIYHQLWNGMIREGEHEKRVHPTQKPVKMLSEILGDFSKEGDSIFDGFGGSGSVLMACEQTGRNCYMIEYEPHYVDVIIARWEKLTGEKAVLL